MIQSLLQLRQRLGAGSQRVTAARNLRFESLEQRTMLAAFTWTGESPGSNVWTDPENWDGPEGEYPDDAGDDVTFDTSNIGADAVQINESPLTIGSLTVQTGFLGDPVRTEINLLGNDVAIGVLHVEGQNNGGNNRLTLTNSGLGRQWSERPVYVRVLAAA